MHQDVLFAACIDDERARESSFFTPVHAFNIICQLVDQVAETVGVLEPWAWFANWCKLSDVSYGSHGSRGSISSSGTFGRC